MKIAQIKNNWAEFKPSIAIGITAVVRDVSLGLVAKGHDVTVFASEGSKFPGVKLRCVGKSLKQLGLHLMHPDSPAAQNAYVKEVIGHLHGFDIIHSHVEHVLLPFLKDIHTPVVSTIHGAGFFPREQDIFRHYPDGFFVALSQGAKRALPYIHFSAVLYNGIRLDQTRYYKTPQPPSYLAWMGRFSENKGVIDAIQASKEAGDILVLVGFEERGQEEYFQKVKDLVDGAAVRLLDRMIGKEKYSFLGNAKAFLFPIHWEEPFGLVMVEAMSAGTPVIAYNRGSVPEIVKDGVTGFIVEPDEVVDPALGPLRGSPFARSVKVQTSSSPSISSVKVMAELEKTRRAATAWIIKKRGVAGLVEAIQRIGEIDRAACRKHVEENFTVRKMVDGYEKLYKKILKSGSSRPR